MKDARYRMVPYGIRAVQSANRWASRMESCEEGAVHQALPLPRGRKRRSLDPLGTAGGQVSVRPGDSAHECAAVASDSEAPLMRQVAGVRGAFLPCADGNARQHAIGVVLGRIYVWAATNGVPGRSVEALLAQLSLANVGIGQKYHHRNSLGRYGTVASQVASVAILHAPGSGTRPGTFHTRVRGEWCCQRVIHRRTAARRFRRPPRTSRAWRADRLMDMFAHGALPTTAAAAAAAAAAVAAAAAAAAVVVVTSTCSATARPHKRNGCQAFPQAAWNGRHCMRFLLALQTPRM